MIFKNKLYSLSDSIRGTQSLFNSLNWKEISNKRLGMYPKMKRKYGTTANLPSRGFPPKLMDRQRRALISEATKCLIIILEELERSTAQMGESFQSCALHKSGLYGKVVGRKM